MPGTRDNPYDLIVVGGGINGAAVARDATMRGLSVGLFEMKDLSAGATWASSGMIHGGLRYLSKDPDVTRLACLDSGFIQQIAPHLIFRIPFVLPWVDKGLTSKVIFELAEVYFDVYDRYQPLKRGMQHTRMSPEEVRHIEPGIRPDILGAITMDEWGIDAQRLTVVNAVDAAERGADLHTYHRVRSLLRDDNANVCGVSVEDRVNGGARDVFGKVTLNACGPWAMEFARAQGVETVGVRPGKGVHLMFAGRITNYAVIFDGIDGRQMFICPHQNTTLIGTTDDDYYGDLSQLPVLESEVAYLLQAAERMFPSIRQYPLIGTTVGCRATLHEWGPYESDLGREHRVWDHEESGAAGFMTLAGGKLASYRVMAEEATDAICQRLGGFGGACETGGTPLPGGHAHDLTIEAFTELGLSGAAARRILYRHGSRAEQIRAMMVDQPRTRALVDPLEPVTEAELRHVIRTEHVVTVDDLKRRSRLGIASDGAARCAVRASQILSEELSIEPDLVPELARDFLQTRWEDRRGIRRAGTCEMEAVTQAISHLSAQGERARPGRPA